MYFVDNGERSWRELSFCKNKNVNKSEVMNKLISWDGLPLVFSPPGRSILFIQTHHGRDAMEETNRQLTPKICNRQDTPIQGVDFLTSWCCGERDKEIAIILKYIEKTLNSWYCTLSWKSVHAYNVMRYLWTSFLHNGKYLVSCHFTLATVDFTWLRSVFALLRRSDEAFG